MKIIFSLSNISYVKPCNVEFKNKAWLLSAWMNRMTRVIALRIYQFVEFAIPCAFNAYVIKQEPNFPRIEM